MKTAYFLLALATTTLSCQTKPKQETTTTSTAATATEDSAAMLAKRPGPDTPRSAADRLIRALYFEHNAKENPFREKKDRALVDQFFAKPVADLIWNDAQKSPGKVNRTKVNLLFNAPDTGIKKTWVLPAVIGGTRAIVYVTFENKAKPEELKIDMKQLAGRWRITEIVYPDGQQLTNLLQ
ncbi:hypothetical protein GO730_18725 [Spirosoma sp. HMF3257]|uniref:DUF3828 domain-containing protein n=1 Tax=Spirosoma telluris TaxID=2183553 RepID=A0A327NMQ2_9BACT|nr:hypothetical protein [Spirosoma telluris]RAI75669.1 hypothetical protein HMF3257_18655 [Spirosoma telluris]